MLISLHIDSKIQYFFLAYLAFVFRINLRMVAKSLPSLVGVIEGQRGSHVGHPIYWDCSLRVSLRRQSETVYWSDFFLGSRTDTLLKRQ